MSYDPTQPESYYRDLLAAQVGGRIEVTLLFGRADVMTSTHVFEVEPITRWRAGAAQAIQYAAQCHQQGALALYGKTANLETVWKELRRLPGPGVQLWWLDEDEFVHLETAEDVQACLPVASKPPAPEPLPPWEPWQPPPAPPEPELGPVPTHNSAGLEIWWSTHLDNGELRPELRGLSARDMARLMAEHAADPTPHQEDVIQSQLGPFLAGLLGEQ